MNACVHTVTKPQTSSTRSRGLGRRIHGSVEDTKFSTNKQHSLYRCWAQLTISALAITWKLPLHGLITRTGQLLLTLDAFLCNILRRHLAKVAAELLQKSTRRLAPSNPRSKQQHTHSKEQNRLAPGGSVWASVTPPRVGWRRRADTTVIVGTPPSSLTSL